MSQRHARRRLLRLDALFIGGGTIGSILTSRPLRDGLALQLTSHVALSVSGSAIVARRKQGRRFLWSLANRSLLPFWAGVVGAGVEAHEAQQRNPGSDFGGPEPLSGRGFAIGLGVGALAALLLDHFWVVGDGRLSRAQRAVMGTLLLVLTGVALGFGGSRWGQYLDATVV